MLTEPLIQQLTELRLRGMAASFNQQLAAPGYEAPELREPARTHDPVRTARARQCTTRAAAALGEAPDPGCRDSSRNSRVTRSCKSAPHSAKADLLVIDDFGLSPLADETVRDLLDILDDRYDVKSTLITSRLPVDQWHADLGDRTVADAILDRLVHDSYRLVLKGESMRERKTTSTTPAAPKSQRR